MRSPTADASYVSFFHGLPEAPQTLRFFRQKGSYVVCGAHAWRIAREFCKGTDAIHTAQQTDVLSLNAKLLGEVLKTHLLEGSVFEAEIYEECSGQWKLEKSGSPADLEDFEVELGSCVDVADVPIVMSAVLGFRDGQRHLGVAFLNNAVHEIGVNMFVDDEGFRNAEFMFVQLGIKECITEQEQEHLEKSRLKSVGKECGVMVIEKPKAVFCNRDVLGDLSRSCWAMHIEQYRCVLEQPLVQSALSGLLQSYDLSGVKYGIKVQSIGCFMKLNTSTLTALNVFPAQPNEPAPHSLYGILNHCKTPMGKRGLKTWLRQPLLDLEEIETRQNIVEIFVQDKGMREDVPFMLRGTPDVTRIIRRLEHRKADLSSLFQLYTFSRKLHPSCRRLEQYRGEHRSLFQERYVKPLQRLTDEEHLQKFEKFWEVAIDSSKLPEEFLLAPRYDSCLTVPHADVMSGRPGCVQEVSVEMEKADRTLRQIAMGISLDLKLVFEKTLKLAWYRSNGLQQRCVRIPNSEERSVRGKLSKRYIVLETLKDGVKFTSHKLTDAAEELQRCKAAYEHLQQELLVQVNEIAFTFLEVFEDTAALMTELDILCALGVASATAPIPFVRPVMETAEKGHLFIRGGRHPLIEAQSGLGFVKNECVMEKGKSWLQFITGPNMGGKSTFIRQVGIIALMAQIGCFVPCDQALLPVRDGIFARVGAGDCQQRGVSTFMAEMLDTTSIFHVSHSAALHARRGLFNQGATDKSLVIIDELGRGTSSCDGLALAWSISEALMTQIGCPTLFATHFHELTELQHRLGVKNTHADARVDEQTGRLVLSFKVCEGRSDAAFGIHVARSAGFPDSVVEIAEKRLKIMEGTE